MALTGEQLVDEVKAICGRPTDTVLLTDARVTRWLNQVQRDIAERCPGLDCLQFKNTASLDLTTDGILYDLTDITAGSDATSVGTVVYVSSVFHVDGANSIRLDYLPLDEFDEQLIDPTSSDHGSGRPVRWTRRGQQIEIAPRPSSDYDGDTLRVDGQFYPADFTTNDSGASELEDADEGLIRGAVSEAWAAVGKHDEAALWKLRFEDWLTEYAAKNGRMEAWGWNTTFDNDA